MTRRPFEDMLNGFVPVPNEVFRVLMPDPDFGKNSLAVLLFILSETAGWGKDWSEMTYEDICNGAGIGSNTTVSKALRQLEDYGLVIIRRAKSVTMVGINKNWQPCPENGQPCPENGQPPVQKMDSAPAVHCPENGQPTYREQKTTYKQLLQTDDDSVRTDDDPVQVLSFAFQQETGILPNPGAWVNDWKVPLENILARSGGLGRAEKAISEAIKRSREKGYTIASPRSINSFAVGVINEGAHKPITLTR